MKANSKFILRWEIDNATATLATGKAESGVFNEGGFKWTAAVEKNDDGCTDFSLLCGVCYNGSWKCEFKMSVYMANDRGESFHWTQVHSLILNESNCVWKCNLGLIWENLTGRYCKINDTVTVEFRINVIYSSRSPSLHLTHSLTGRMDERVLENGETTTRIWNSTGQEFTGEPVADTSKFAAPNNKSNYLAVHSPVFDTLFFGDFAEKGKDEVELKDEFIDLLNVVYLETVEITDRSVVHILKLADQFQMARMLNISAKHLIKSKGIDVMKKLLLADQYRLTTLKKHCLNSFISVNDVTAKLKSSLEYDNLSADMQAAILKRIVMLS